MLGSGNPYNTFTLMFHERVAAADRPALASSSVVEGPKVKAKSLH